MIKQTVNNRYEIPDEVSGYELDPTHGWFSIVIPEYGENLCTNPSFEIDASGWGVSSASAVTQSSAVQRRGSYSGVVTPTGANGLAYFTLSLTAGQPYTFSIDFRDTAGREIWLYWAASGAVTVPLSPIKKIRGANYWKRNFVTYTAASSTTYSAVIQVRNLASNLNPIQIDGALIQNKTYPTTYFDGDSVGYLDDPTAYGWNGMPGLSSSVRIANTGSGGRELDILDDLGFHVMSFVGLGMNNLTNLAIPLAGGGAYYQETFLNGRQFSLAGYMATDDPDELERTRADLVDALYPKGLPIDQLMTLKYHRVDDFGNETETVVMPCKFIGGLEGAVSNLETQRLALTFQMYGPMYFETELGGVIPFSTTAFPADGANVSLVLKRDRNQAYTKYGVSAGVAACVARGENGLLYIGGNFDTVDGVAGFRGAGAMDPVLGTFAKLGTGVGNDVVADNQYVNALAFSRNGTFGKGTLYAGGTFTVAAGANFDYFSSCNLNTNTWAALGGASPNGEVTSILPMEDLASIYIAGNFTQVGATPAARIAKFYSTVPAWSALGTGCNGLVKQIIAGPDRNIYVCGEFTSAGGVANTKYIARWNTWSSAWESIGGMDGGNRCQGMVFGADGYLYAFGDFTSAGGITVSGFAVYNGSSWAAVGQNNIFFPIGKAHLNPSGKISFYVRATTLNNISYTPYEPAGYELKGGIFRPMDLVSYYNSFSNRNDGILLEAQDSEFFIGSFNALDATRVGLASGTITLNNTGETSYPVFRIRGPGKLQWIKNFTTGQTIYFQEYIGSAVLHNSGISLRDYEIVTLITDPMYAALYSDITGSLMKALVPGFGMGLQIVSGVNILGALFLSTGANSLIRVSYRPATKTTDRATW